MSTEKPKPCPFCGCKDVQSWNPGGAPYYCVECTGCNVRTGYIAPELEAIAVWNRRTEASA